MKKICCRCKKEKEYFDFYLDSTKRDGLYSYCIECRKIYYINNKDRISKIKKKSRIKHKDEIKEYTKKYILNNRDIIKKKRHEFRKKHRKYINEYEKNRRRINYRVRLRYNVSSMMTSRLKRRLLDKGKKSIFNILPYTIEDLMNHLEKKFKLGMTWQNYGKWHIDHIKPDSLFHYKSVNDEEFKRCWSLENLQPLWADDNIKKSNHY